MKLSVAVFGGVQLLSLLLLTSLQAATVQFAPNSSGSDFNVLVAEDSGVATLVVNRIGDLDQSVSARFETVDDRAVAGSDYVAANRVVTFGPGEIQKAINLSIHNDGVREELEWFRVTLTKADERTVIGTNQTARVGINDNDLGFQFTMGSLVMSENEEVARVAVRLDNDGPGVRSIQYRLIPGSAKPGEDYGELVDALSFAPGETVKSFDIIIVNDTRREETETFQVELFNPSGASVASPIPLQIVIFDDDTGPAIEYYPRAIAETAGPFSVRILRGINPGQSFSVEYYTTNRSATAGADYGSTSGTLQFGPLEDAKTITIPIHDDWLAEGDEQFEIVLANPSSGIPLNEQSRAVVTIHDDERPLALDLSFTCQVQGYANTLVIQPDGRLLIGGASLRGEGDEPQALIRLFPDGTLDRSFGAQLRPLSDYSVATVSTMTPLPDGGVLVAGIFDANGPRFLARLRSDGALDQTFNAAALPISVVNAIVWFPDGKLLVGGGGDSPSGRGARLLRLAENGSLITDLSSRFQGPGEIYALVRQPDGSVLVGGSFNSGTNALLRLRLDESADEAFRAEVRFSAGSAGVRSLALLNDGRIYITGQFDGVNGQTRVGLARLLPDGRLDEIFAPGSVADGRAVIPWSRGGVFVLGNSMDFANGQRFGLALVNETGALVPEFNPTTQSSASFPALALDAEGRPWVAAFYHSGAPSCPIARLVLDSTTNKAVRITTTDQFGYNVPVREDAGFHTLIAERFGHTDEPVSVTFATREGSAIGGLDYVSTNGVINFLPGERTNQFRIALLDDALVEDSETFQVGVVSTLPATVTPSTASLLVTLADDEVPAILDGEFNSPFVPYSVVSTIIPDPDGKVIVAGKLITTPSSQQEFSLVRLNANGSIDTVFQTGHPRSTVTSIAVQPDRKVIASGNFVDPTSLTRTYLVRFNTDGSLDSTFAGTNLLARFSRLVLQADGKILGVTEGSLIRLNSDGTQDSSFSAPYFRPTVTLPTIMNAAVTQSESVLVCGSFTNVSWKPYQGIVRLNPDGSLDESMLPIRLTGGHFETPVRAVAELQDGKILIGGEFRSVNGVPRFDLARLNHDGSLDASFDPGVLLSIADSGGVRQPIYFNAMLVRPDGKILVSAGSGYWLQNWGFFRLNPNGSLDSSFRFGLINAWVEGDGLSQASARAIMTMAFAADGMLLIGGEVSHINGQPRQGIARLRPEPQGLQSIGFASAEYVAGEATGEAIITLGRVGDLTGPATVRYEVRGGTAMEGVDFLASSGSVTFGTIESTKSFTIPLSGDADYEADETVLLTLSTPSNRALLDRTSATLRIADDERPGSLDFSFAPKVDFPASWLPEVVFASQRDGSLNFLVSGRDPDSARFHWARLTENGELDSTFSDHGTNYSRMFALNDGKLLATTEISLVRLNADGSLDPTFNSPPGQIRYVGWAKPLPDGKILLSATIYDSEGTSRAGVFRLHSDGTLDDSFVWPLDYLARVLATIAMADGRLYMAGYFPDTGGPSRRHLARLLPDGQLDLTFDPHLAPDLSAVTALALTSDGRLLAAGNFRTSGMTHGVSCARFLENGDWDPTFAPAVAEPANGRDSLYDFSILVDELGRVLLAGAFARVKSVPRGGIARLNSDGTLDSSFDPGYGVGTMGDYVLYYGNVGGMALQSDGQIVISGGFNSVNGVPARLLARLNGDPAHRFSNVAWLPDGSVHLTLTGRADREQVVEASVDLRIWTPIFTNAPARQSIIEDRETRAFSHKFYRARRR